jgi:hypothetical protein
MQHATTLQGNIFEEATTEQTKGETTSSESSADDHQSAVAIGCCDDSFRSTVAASDGDSSSSESSRLRAAFVTVIAEPPSDVSSVVAASSLDGGGGPMASRISNVTADPGRTSTARAEIGDMMTATQTPKTTVISQSSANPSTIKAPADQVIFGTAAVDDVKMMPRGGGSSSRGHHSRSGLGQSPCLRSFVGLSQCSSEGSSDVCCDYILSWSDAGCECTEAGQALLASVTPWLMPNATPGSIMQLMSWAACDGSGTSDGY